MSDYAFVTNWDFDAPLDHVWNLIEAAEKWPEWWKGVLSVTEISPGDENGIGSIRRTAWKSALPYKLEFDTELLRIERHRLIEVRAFGELDGLGLWQFEALNENRTYVRYDWTVKTTKAWMKILAPVAKPFFRWNHDTIMRWGEEGLRRRLSLSAVS